MTIAQLQERFANYRNVRIEAGESYLAFFVNDSRFAKFIVFAPIEPREGVFIFGVSAITGYQEVHEADIVAFIRGALFAFA